MCLWPYCGNVVIARLHGTCLQIRLTLIYLVTSPALAAPILA